MDGCSWGMGGRWLEKLGKLKEVEERTCTSPAVKVEGRSECVSSLPAGDEGQGHRAVRKGRTFESRNTWTWLWALPRSSASESWCHHPHGGDGTSLTGWPSGLRSISCERATRVPVTHRAGWMGAQAKRDFCNCTNFLSVAQGE